MAKPLPKKYFTGYTAQIHYRKVDKWAEYHAKNGIAHYFDTWEEAHKYMMDTATSGVSRAEKDLASAKRHLEKVKKMKAPEPISEPKQEPKKSEPIRNTETDDMSLFFPPFIT